jgi:hypothetical protein
MTAVRIGVEDKAPMTVEVAQFGRPKGSLLSIAPALAAPSAPTNVNVTVVSTSELGVYWDPPAYDGDAAVSGVLFRWALLFSVFLSSHFFVDLFPVVFFSFVCLVQ